MLTTIEGVYRNGKIEFSKTPRDVCDGTPVIVTFLPSHSVDLQERGIDQAQAGSFAGTVSSLCRRLGKP